MKNHKTNRGKRLTRKQAAKYLGVSEGTLSVWATVGRYNLPYFKAGRKVIYFQSDLDAFIESHMIDTHGGAAA